MSANSRKGKLQAEVAAAQAKALEESRARAPKTEAEARALRVIGAAGAQRTVLPQAMRLERQANMQRRRSRAESDALRAEVYRLHLLGKPNNDIAVALKITNQYVANMLAQIEREWRNSARVEVDTMRKRELSKLDAIESELWKAWEDSKTGSITITESASDQFGVSTVTKTVQNSVGNVVYMAAIQNVISQRMKIIGGYAPTVIVHDYRAALEESGAEVVDVFEYLVGAIVAEQGASVIEGSFSEAERRTD